MANTVIPGPASGEMGNPEVRKARRDAASGHVEGPTSFQRAEMPQPAVRTNGVGGGTGMRGTASVNRGGSSGKVGVGRRRGARG